MAIAPLPGPGPDLGAEPAAEATAVPADPGALLVLAQRDAQIRAGASWLLWIAGLSLVNIAAALGDSDFAFALGLFAAQLVAVLGKTIGVQAGLPAIGYVSGVLAAGMSLVFGALWFPARAGKRWVLLVALVLYGLDLLLLLAILASVGEMDPIGIGIHAWALWALFRAWSAAKPIPSIA